MHTIIPAYQGQMPIWTVMQAHPNHNSSQRIHQLSSDSNQCLQHHSQCPLVVLSPKALRSRKREEVWVIILHEQNHIWFSIATKSTKMDFLPWLFCSFCLVFQQNISLMKTPPQFHRMKQQDLLPRFQVKHKKQRCAYQQKLHSKHQNRRIDGIEARERSMRK